MFSLLYTFVLIFISLSLHASGGQKFQIQRPSKAPSQIEIHLTKVKNDILSAKSFNQNTCSDYLKSLAQYMEANAYTSKFVEINEKSYLDFEHSALTSLRLLFEIRLALKEKLSYMPNPSKSCVNGVRKTLRFARYAEESISEWYVTRIPQKDISGVNFQSNNPVQKLVNPLYYDRPEDFRFESGDILLVRTTSFFGATIARIGDEAGQFNHAILIYKPEPGDKNYGKTYIIEAQPETGAIVSLLEDWVRKTHARSIVFRMKPRYKAYANEAAKHMFERLEHQIDEDGNPLTGLKLRRALKHPNAIEYNFSMDLNNNNKNEYFCSQLVREAYIKASNGKLRIPRFETSFERLAGSDLLKSLVVKTASSFAPNDLEIEPAVDLVAEYRDLSKMENGMFHTQHVKIEDAFFSSFFDWKVNKHYRIQTNFIDSAIAWLGHTYTQSVQALGLSSKYVPDKAPKAFLDRIVAIQLTYTPILEEVSAFDLENFRRVGYSTPYLQLKEIFEKERQMDCEKYLQESSDNRLKDKSRWHRNFHPMEGISCDNKIGPISKEDVDSLRAKL